MLRNLLCGISTKTNDSAVKPKRNITERRATVPQQLKSHGADDILNEREFAHQSKSHVVVAKNRSLFTG